LETVTGNQFKLFANGEMAERSQKIHKVFNKDTKLLLYSGSESAVARPSGIRWFCRFPKHITNDDQRSGTDEQTVCFVPLADDVDIIGFGSYRHSYDSIEYMEVRMKIRITNESDADPPILEKAFETIELTYANHKFDANKMTQYDFVKEKGWEPIRVKAGQHLHLTHSFYHRSTTERFHYGVEGDKYNTVQNMDMGVFKVMDSRFHTDSTNLERGQIPGLMYKFVESN